MCTQMFTCGSLLAAPTALVFGIELGSLPWLTSHAFTTEPFHQPLEEIFLKRPQITKIKCNRLPDGMCCPCTPSMPNTRNIIHRLFSRVIREYWAHFKPRKPVQLCSGCSGCGLRLLRGKQDASQVERQYPTHCVWLNIVHRHKNEAYSLFPNFQILVIPPILFAFFFAKKKNPTSILALFYKAFHHFLVCPCMSMYMSFILFPALKNPCPAFSWCLSWMINVSLLFMLFIKTTLHPASVLLYFSLPF